MVAYFLIPKTTLKCDFKTLVICVAPLIKFPLYQEEILSYFLFRWLNFKYSYVLYLENVWKIG